MAKIEYSYDSRSQTFTMTGPALAELMRRASLTKEAAQAEDALANKRKLEAQSDANK